ncbi:MAG: hypothetical protein GQ470_02495 [Gammaproteobacteria bacterium]|nr:hypothetical protein [Gammaproteobacteria bacterium]
MPVTIPRQRRLYPLALTALLLASPAWGEVSLHERYPMLKSGLGTTLPGTTITLASAEQGEVLSAEVSSILHYPFDTVATALARAENWCQFMPLHFNIKACTYETREGGERLNVYSGRKIYQPPEDSYQMAYRFETIQQNSKRLSLRLSAEDGPAGTRDYRIELDALEVEDGTMLYMRSSYRPSLLSSILTQGYLTTLGRNKVGFSHIEEDGKSRLVRGKRGVIERNVMRYHLAIDAYLSTQTLPRESRHEAALERWFSLNDGYPKQLDEMSKEDYFEGKRREWQNQLQLQQALIKGNP